MPLDPSIFQLAGRGVKSIADYDADYAQANHNSLSQALGLVQLEGAKTAQTRANKLMELAPQGVEAMRKGGFWKEAGEIDKNAADVDAKRAEAAKTKLEGMNLALTQHRALLNNVNDIEGARAWLAAAYQNPETKPIFERLGPMDVALSRFDSSVRDPEMFQKWKTGASVNADELVKLTTPDANAKLSAQTSRDNNAATNATSVATNAATNARVASEGAANRKQSQAHFDAAAELGKIPPGYRRLADGSLEAIPGGPAALGKALPTKLVTDLGEQAGIADSTERFRTTFKPDYAGKYVMGDLSNTSKRVMGDDSGQSQWWQDYAMHEATIRNKLFGASLTPGEQAQWQKLTITPRMDAAQVQQNLDRRAAIEQRALDRMATGAAAGGYNKEQIEAVTGRPLGGKSPTTPIQPTGAPKAGTVQDGYRFKGGNPADKSNWEKA